MAKFTSLVCGMGSLALLATACETPESATSLNPDGPPMITQVFLNEVQGTQSGVVLAFGKHDSMSTERTHPVTQAKLSDQIIRVVVDELLLGNSLEEVACRARTGCVVGSEEEGNLGWSRIPIGATPDDIANCIVPNDVLESSCVGEHAMCLSPEGMPCGILDETPKDGGLDALRFISGQVELLCTDTNPATDDIVVAVDQDKSFWQPSGNQLVPPRVEANGVLGPALILIPNSGATLAQAKTLLPSSQTCSLQFAEDVTDKDGIRICAPPDGDTAMACPADGDVSLFSFDTVPMTMNSSTPAEGTTGVSTSGFVIAYFNTVPSESSTVSIHPADSSTPVTGYTFTVQQMDSAIFIGFSSAPLQPGTEYVVDLTGVKDYYGVPLASPSQLTFTTAPAAPAQ